MSARRERFVRVWRNDPGNPRSRFRLEWPADESGDELCVILADEEVIAADPLDPDARNIESYDVMWLAQSDVRRLRDALTELLAVMPPPDDPI